MGMEALWTEVASDFGGGTNRSWSGMTGDVAICHCALSGLRGVFSRGAKNESTESGAVWARVGLGPP